MAAPAAAAGGAVAAGGAAASPAISGNTVTPHGVNIQLLHLFSSCNQTELLFQ